LITRFNLMSLVVLLVSCGGVGWWISHRIEQLVLNRVGYTTSLFAGSVVAPVVEATDAGYADSAGADLSTLLDPAGFGPEIVAYKIWGNDGDIRFSSDPDEVGKRYEMDDGLLTAWDGRVHTEITDLDRPEHVGQRPFADHLLEIYTPVRRPRSGEITAVLEFYLRVSEFEDELRAARVQSWGIAAVVVAAIYGLLITLVRRGNRTILLQSVQLEAQVQEYRDLLAENIRLSRRLRSAADGATTLNEEYLRRVAADLHDGPAQDIGYAILTVDTPGRSAEMKELLERTLQEIRNISTGLRMPDLESLTLADVIQRAVTVHESRTGCTVAVESSDLPDDVTTAARITIFRVLQESLSNAYRHGEDCAPRVTARCDDDSVYLEIADSGPGIGSRPTETGRERLRLGLAVMKERVELMNGTLRIERNTPRGTRIVVEIPQSSVMEERREAD